MFFASAKMSPWIILNEYLASAKMCPFSNAKLHSGFVLKCVFGYSSIVCLASEKIWPWLELTCEVLEFFID